MTERHHGAGRIRKRHPNHVPVICAETTAPGNSPGTSVKLLAPCAMSWGEFLLVVRARVPAAAEEGARCLVGGSRPSREATLAALDAASRGDDGFLYVEVLHADAAAARRVPSHGTHGADAAARATARHAAEAARLLVRHPDRVPVLCRQPPSEGLPQVSKKMLTPRSMPCCDLKSVIRRYVNFEDGRAIDWSKVHVLAGGSELRSSSELMSDLYDRLKGEDALLHLNLVFREEEPSAAASSGDQAEEVEDGSPASEAEEVGRSELDIVDTEHESEVPAVLDEPVQAPRDDEATEALRELLASMTEKLRVAEERAAAEAERADAAELSATEARKEAEEERSKAEEVRARASEESQRAEERLAAETTRAEAAEAALTRSRADSESALCDAEQRSREAVDMTRSEASVVLANLAEKLSNLEEEVATLANEKETLKRRAEEAESSRKQSQERLIDVEARLAASSARTRAAEVMLREAEDRARQSDGTASAAVAKVDALESRAAAETRAAAVARRAQREAEAAAAAADARALRAEAALAQAGAAEDSEDGFVHVDRPSRTSDGFQYIR
eukprot:TRINITY_DN75026_c0_g1_i1.p1 TRINITY_DN75026_c0_g1~~TRINITY_DN75026_c0_g1_i1.p1  ORF type:complete len:596 (+),score=166.00 TRINITY_DN75026_c0_g1_i1:97-1788(+)